MKKEIKRVMLEGACVSFSPVFEMGQNIFCGAQFKLFGLLFWLF